MSDDSEKIVFLAHVNPNAPSENVRDVLACKACHNKTFVLECAPDVAAKVVCACCGSNLGNMGWHTS